MSNVTTFFLTLSHTANILITITVASLMLANAPGMDTPFGPDSTARRILACLYLSIAVASMVALFAHWGLGRADLMLTITLVLLPIQIVYKLTTALAVGVDNPVVMTNLNVVALHTVTLFFVWRSWEQIAS